MSTRFVALKGFLEPLVRDRRALTKALDALRPLYAAAELGEFRLAKMAAFDHRTVRIAINLGTDRPASGLLLLPLRKLAPRLVGLLRWSALGDALRDGRMIPLRSRLPAPLRDGIEQHVQEFESAIETALWDAVWENAPDELIGKPAMDVLYGVRTAVWSYLALVALEDDDARRLAPLIRLLSAGIILGESNDLPGTWVVLVGS